MRQITRRARIRRNVYGLLMVLEFMGDLIAAMRRYARLKPEEFGEKVGKSAAQIERLENNERKTAIKVELERQIVEATGVTKPIFAQLLAEVATKYLGVRLVVLPKDALVPSNHVLHAIWLFSNHERKLDEEERESIDRLLDDLRCHDAQAERLSKSVAKDIIRQINKARRKQGEDPSGDSGD